MCVLISECSLASLIAFILISISLRMSAPRQDLKMKRPLAGPARCPPSSVNVSPLKPYRRMCLHHHHHRHHHALRQYRNTFVIIEIVIITIIMIMLKFCKVCNIVASQVLMSCDVVLVVVV